MFGLSEILTRWRSRRDPLPSSLWQHALARHAYAQKLPKVDQARLRALASLFLHTKAIDPVAGIRITDAMRAELALRAAVPILNLGLDWYRNWYAVVVYPGDFRVRREFVDDDGVVHEGLDELCGESLAQGPMVISWQAVDEDAAAPGYDVVAHECAHKIDLLSGDANGCPPLHAGMNPAHWTMAFDSAFEALNNLLDRDEEPSIDPYAASDPAEFFAVATEVFFTAPQPLASDFPAVYEQLRIFYRQDPACLLSTAERAT